MENIITVGQLSNYIKQIFEAEEMLYNISVVGEVLGLNIVRGVAYFTLKDENATLSCVCFDESKFNFSNGDSIVIVGTPRYYTKGGKLNFNVVNITKSGQGELYQKFMLMKQKLELKGYFSQEHKINMPSSIKRIGVVSSREGAVIQDIINVGTRRNPYVDIVLYPVKVQGNGAENEIAKGIAVLDNYNVDLIIVARGGGSLEDLQPFNTEAVADAVYNAKKFIVSAVGHETDFTICDFCADLRAPTPSAAAELVFANVSEKNKNIMLLSKRMWTGYKQLFEHTKRYIVDMFQNIYHIYGSMLIKSCNEIKSIKAKLNEDINNIFNEEKYNLGMLEGKLKKLNPEDILKLGYNVLKKNGQYVFSNDISVGDRIEIISKKDCITASVESIKEK